MKIATFNVNNVNKRVVNLLDWLRMARPDVACLQGLKATDSEFPIAAIKKAGYGAVWQGQKSWNGVAILARDCEPVVTSTLVRPIIYSTNGSLGCGHYDCGGDQKRGHITGLPAALIACNRPTRG